MNRWKLRRVRLRVRLYLLLGGSLITGIFLNPYTYLSAPNLVDKLSGIGPQLISQFKIRTGQLAPISDECKTHSPALVRYSITTPVSAQVVTTLNLDLNQDRGWKRAGITFIPCDQQNSDVVFVIDPEDPEWARTVDRSYGLCRCAAFNAQPKDTRVDTIVIRNTPLLSSQYVVNHELGHKFGLDHTPDGLMGYQKAFPTEDEIFKVQLQLGLAP